MEDAGIDEIFLNCRKAEIKREFIACFKTDIFDVFSQSEGGILEDALGARTVLFNKPYALCRGYPVGLEKDNDIANSNLLVPRGFNCFCAGFPDARDFMKASRVTTDDVQSVCPKVINYFSGIGFPDTVNHAAAQVFTDPMDRSGQARLELANLELLPV